MIRHRISTLLAAALLAPALASAATAQPAAPLRVKLVTGSAEPNGHWVAANVAAAQRATLSTRASATVRTVAVEEGAHVRRGQVLVRLADADLRAQLAAADAALATARAQERRLTALLAERAATPAELEVAQAERARASAGVSAAREALAYTELRAPFDGRVAAKRVSAGDLVGPGQPLLDLEGGALELQASLSDQESTALRIGDRLTFRAGDHRGEARVTALTAGGDPLSHRRFLRAAIEQPDGLRPGLFARLELRGGPAPAAEPWVPRSALVQRGDLTGVYVAEGGKALLRWISVGAPAGDGVLVRAGLAPGEPVIDAPGALRDGQAVEVADGR